MSLNIIDVIILLFLLMGAVLGYKRGAIQTVATLIGTIFIVVLAYYLKNPLSVLMYTYLPFFKLGGVFEGITVINILIYEAIAFFLVLSILSILLSVLLKVTGVISKIIDHSIILTLPSKLLGIFIGFLEAYVFLFIVLFLFSQFSFSQVVLKESKYTDVILTKTPFTKGFQNSYTVFKEISNVQKKEDEKEQEKNDYEALNLLLKYEILTPENADKLVKKGKININGAKELIKKYEGGIK